MGDLPKPSDDATWTEVERSFFAAAPPEDLKTLIEAPRFDDQPAPAPEQPRRRIIAWLRPSMNAARRRVTLVCAATGGLAQRTWRGTRLALGAAGAPDRRRLVLALVGAIAVAGVSGFRGGAPTKEATGEREGPAGGPTVAEAGPVAPSASEAGPRPNVGSPGGVRSARADATNRAPRAHRRSVAASPPAQRPVVTAFMDRQTFWAREGRSAPGRSGRPFFSR